jgi:small-conductance mechanosensitive channel
MSDFWQQIYFRNSIKNWTIAISIIIIGFIFLRIIKKGIVGKLKKWTSRTEITFDDFIISTVEHSGFPLLYILIVYAGVNWLNMPVGLHQKLVVAIWIVVMFFVLKTITSAVKYFIFTALEKNGDSETRKKQAAGLIIILNVTIWVVGFIFLLDNLGYNIGTLIAGLGIGGIAIALAAQTILGDLFSYFVIFFDKPFEIGDFIGVDDKAGSVEYIGIKTTRIRTPAGEQLICSNKDLTDSRVHNYGRMQKRRVVFNIGVTYQTAAAKLKKIDGMVKDIIEMQEEVQFDRAHFVSFGDSSLNFEIVYYILTPDYTLFMNKQQEILFAIFEAFEKEKIEFAYPTQTLFLQGESPAIEEKQVNDFNT